MDAPTLARLAGLDLSRFSFGERTAISNALYAAYTKGYEIGWGAAYVSVS